MSYHRSYLLLVLLSFQTVWAGVGEPHRIYLVPGYASALGDSSEIVALISDLHQELGQFPFIEFVLNENEQNEVMKEWERQLGPEISEDYQVEMGELKGAEKYLKVNIYRTDSEGYSKYEVVIYDLKDGSKTFAHFSAPRSEKTSLIAERLAHRAKVELAPSGKILKVLSRDEVEVSIGKGMGLENEVKLVKRAGEREVARLKTTRAGLYSSEAEIEKGKVAAGDVVFALLEEVVCGYRGKGGILTIQAPQALESASVAIDREIKGRIENGRLELCLWPGEHLVEVKGRRSIEETVFLPSDGYLLVLDLPGVLSLQSDDGARIEVRKGANGEWQELGKGRIRSELPAGRHQVRIRKPGFIVHREEIVMEGGKEVHRVISPLAKAEGMALVEGGNVVLGSTDEKDNPPHRVELRSYYLDTREVSVAAFRTVFPNYRPIFPNYPDDRAALGVSWFDAKEYCEKVGKRLPTEAEWERACRGPQDLQYGYGDHFDLRLTDARTHQDKVDEFPLRVDSSNGYGMYDMTGGVWEWCQDAYQRDIDKIDSEDPVHDDFQADHVLRGGAWIMEAPRRRASCVYRFHMQPGDQHESPIGFRCAADAE